VYLGAERMLKSTNRGDTWSAISDDLTGGRPNPDTGEGATITTLAESPVMAGVLWAGTDDGRVQVSKDGGGNWTDVTDRIPAIASRPASRRPWVSRVEASPAETAAAFVSFDGHRLDEFGAYLFATRDFGQTWTSIAGNLPPGVPVNVVRADARNPDLLFVGTETGVYASLDRGGRWTRLATGLPTVPVDDLVIHPRDGDLVAGTHGRSIYVLDATPLQQLTSQVLASTWHVFAPRPATLFTVDLTRNTGASGARRFQAPNPFTHLVEEGDATGLAPPGARIHSYVRDAPAAPLRLRIEDSSGRLVRELEAPAQAGLNHIDWDLRTAPLPPLPAWRRVGGNDSRRLSQEAARGRPGPLVGPGDYRVIVLLGDERKETTVRVEADSATARRQ
jgi:hypothetical protein